MNTSSDEIIAHSLQVNIITKYNEMNLGIDQNFEKELKLLEDPPIQSSNLNSDF